MDKYTRQRIEKLHPSVIEEVTNIINDCDKALSGKAKIRITESFRTIEEQNLIFSQGRSTPGKK